MRKKSCCAASSQLYDDYYRRQSGGEIPVFIGRRYQRGHGIGSLLGGLFRRFVMPFVRDNAKKVGANLLRTGMNIAGDVMSGRNLKESAKEHVSRGIKRTADDLDWESAPPIASKVGRKIVKTGANIVGDVIEGKRPIKETLKEEVGSLFGQTGSGRRRRHIKRKGCQHRDIFS